MSAKVYNIRDYQKPAPTSTLEAQGTGLVSFINGLTAKDQLEPMEFNAHLNVWPDFSSAGAFHAPDKDLA